MALLTRTAALDRLASLHLRARLVPVLGAGMSAHPCVTWCEFVENLETIAHTRREGEGKDALVERSHRALTALRRSGADLVGSISRALVSGGRTRSRDIPSQTKALATLHWPLVLTTNYDDLYVEAVRRGDDDPGPKILGRSELDCQRVLTALHEPSDPILWALHGYVGGVARDRPRPLPIPEGELVVGHDEYRRVTHTAAHFRRAFSEVLRNRSLLFLGCGLGDPHLTGLLEETLALTGASPVPHYAVIFDEDGSSHREWVLRARLSIQPIVLARFSDLPDFLQDLRRRIVAPRSRLARWPVHLSCSAAEEPGEPPLEIVRGPLPENLGAGECLCVSAGRAGTDRRVRPWFSNGIWAQLNRMGIDDGTEWPDITTACAFRVPDRPVIVGFARTTDFKLFGRDARLIARTTEAVLRLARDEGFRTVHAQLLAAGGGSPFPPRVSLAHMLRGFSRFHAKSGPCPRLLVHVIDSELLLELDGQRLDVLELLDHESVRFWVEISDDAGRAERELRHESYQSPLRDIAAPLFTDSRGWNVTVYPGATRADETRDVVAAADSTLEELGILPGATLRFQRGWHRADRDDR